MPNYISMHQLLKSFKVFVIGDEGQLHHVTCSEAQTLVLRWPANMAGGMCLIDLADVAQEHELQFHSRLVA